MPVKTSVVFEQTPDQTMKEGSYVAFEDVGKNKAVGIIYDTLEEAEELYFDIMVLASESQFFKAGEAYRKGCLYVEPFYGKIEIEVT